MHPPPKPVTGSYFTPNENQMPYSGLQGPTQSGPSASSKTDLTSPHCPSGPLQGSHGALCQVYLCLALGGLCLEHSHPRYLVALPSCLWVIPQISVSQGGSSRTVLCKSQPCPLQAPPALLSSLGSTHPLPAFSVSSLSTPPTLPFLLPHPITEL